MPIQIPTLLEQELSLRPEHVQNVLSLLAEGATIPFIARYRKEQTGEMNEIVLRQLIERNEYLTELEARKHTVLETIRGQGKLTPELEAQIDRTLIRTELEDLYLPYKPKKRTRATDAKAKGLEPLALWIGALQSSAVLTDEAAKFISEEKGVKTVEEALAGASDILAETVAEKAEHRQYVREFIAAEGVFRSGVKAEFAETKTKFDMYRDYTSKVKEIPAHNMLALRRGEEEGVLSFTLEFDDAAPKSYLRSKEIPAGIADGESDVKKFYVSMLDDSFSRLMKNSLVAEVRLTKKEAADLESIQTFEKNLRSLLLASPAGMKRVLGVDPGFRTGCKIVALDETGKFLEYQAVFPHQSENERKAASSTVAAMIETHKIELVAIGNGTAGRETETFINETLAALKEAKPELVLPASVMVSEAGASVYSASKVAAEEFPDKDVTIRGAISIARRLQDPLAELVKIDPKSLGVGQYQHDVDQRQLRKKLDDVTESCVNFVGVDLNTASKELLSYVAGMNLAAAKSIVEFRNANGAFKDRASLMQVPKVGPKLFEQAAGFLRIRGAENPLDNSAVHPESYAVVEKMAADLNLPVAELVKRPDAVKQVDAKKYTTETAGELTVRDILEELQKPGRDPREEFKYAAFRADIKTPKDLQGGMMLEGVVTNVANFGAFVDIGVHQDGLVHVSQLANRFVKDPNEVVKVGQVVKVKVLEVDLALNRISLTMKTEDAPRASQGRSGQGQSSQGRSSQGRESQERSSQRPAKPEGSSQGAQGRTKQGDSRRYDSKQSDSKRYDSKRNEPKHEDSNRVYSSYNSDGNAGETPVKPQGDKDKQPQNHSPEKSEKNLASGIDALKAKFNSK
ncbi:MAG: helix-hairpin-helix domain-containing protein [Rhizobacter sp.]|nr:helix-hairpin-helix domain-containing protein [Chlorobiales bacterium]